LPFGAARTSPVDTQDVAEVIATILANPTGHVGQVYELTGPQTLDMHSLAAEYGAALHRSVQTKMFRRGNGKTSFAVTVFRSTFCTTC